jgi:hypothetical protein
MIIDDNDESIQVLLDCELDLELTYSQPASTQLMKTVIEKENTLGRKLSKEEIIEEYRKVDNRYFMMFMTGRGK